MALTAPVRTINPPPGPFGTARKIACNSPIGWAPMMVKAEHLTTRERFTAYAMG